MISAAKKLRKIEFEDVELEEAIISALEKAAKELKPLEVRVGKAVYKMPDRLR
jgi:hypothetical protein